jgi:hypothetical protein
VACNGFSTNNIGIAGGSTNNYALQGASTNSTGVRASGANGLFCTATSGRGGILQGVAAQLKLIPSSASTHPVSGQAGDMFVDSSNGLWFCKGGSTWVQLA